MYQNRTDLVGRTKEAPEGGVPPAQTVYGAAGGPEGEPEPQSAPEPMPHQYTRKSYEADLQLLRSAAATEFLLSSVPGSLSSTQPPQPQYTEIPVRAVSTPVGGNSSRSRGPA
eukprot:COSAG05_NODE_7907_length_757_cov_1.658055_1_plen_112_part_01